MSRFVILEHDQPVLHWDLMLEAGNVLRTWRLAEAPEAGKRVAAEASFDHRLLYLDYEGPISGGRGAVTRWDSGTYEGELPPAGDVELQLQGVRLCGRAVLQHVEGAAWSFTVEAKSSAGA